MAQKEQMEAEMQAKIAELRAQVGVGRRGPRGPGNMEPVGIADYEKYREAEPAQVEHPPLARSHGFAGWLPFRLRRYQVPLATGASLVAPRSDASLQ